MTNVESGRAAAEAREQMTTDPTATAKHGGPLVRYLGAVTYQENKKKDENRDEKAE
ncbi:hypothetical protein [Kutzneria sp. CA-103260]|uniref:hypothetical protein n=1 Tax=Kutzneria sp. CA-103260 TaxID=2802641 RepID=UPI001BAA136A|nr:hypothetical protein [Kutzneria sp. CA-103260]QUQ64076.1 hypothetical protein JJ691_17960 [Kutzneria sp. CA-103260]